MEIKFRILSPWKLYSEILLVEEQLKELPGYKELKSRQNVLIIPVLIYSVLAAGLLFGIITLAEVVVERLF